MSSVPTKRLCIRNATRIARRVMLFSSSRLNRKYFPSVIEGLSGNGQSRECSLSALLIGKRSLEQKTRNQANRRQNAKILWVRKHCLKRAIKCKTAFQTKNSNQKATSPPHTWRTDEKRMENGGKMWSNELTQHQCTEFKPKRCTKPWKTKEENNTNGGKPILTSHVRSRTKLVRKEVQL